MTKLKHTTIPFKYYDKKCELTGVLPLKGHNVNANNKTKRRFLPNLKDFFKSDILKRSIRLNGNAALRTVDFKGGLDKFLKTAKRKNLSKRVQKLKYSIVSQK